MENEPMHCPITAKKSKPMKNAQTHDAATVESLVASAPPFWHGAAALKQHIVSAANAFLGKVPEHFGADGAKKAGEQDGLFEDGGAFSFQNDCQAAYNKASLDTGRAIGTIVAHEGEQVQRTIAGEFPDMERELRHRVSPQWANKHLECAEQLYGQQIEQKRFLRERGLPLGGSMTIHGDYGLKFWLPLAVVVIAEFYFNYLLLDPAGFREKFVIALASVSVVLGGGFAVSWLWKFSRSVIKRNNRLSIMQKVLCWAGIIVACAIFFAALLFLVYYRAGISMLDGGPIMDSLTKAFSTNATDFVLAIINILFFGVTIVTFNKAGWPIHGYGKVHEQLQSAKNAYEYSNNTVDSAAKEVFNAAHKNMEQRLEDVRMMLQGWDAMSNVVAEIPEMIKTVNTTIGTRYKVAIEIYRGAFADARSGSADADLARNPVPEEIRVGAPIERLNAIQPPEIINLDLYREQANAFGQAAQNWAKENSDLAKLQVASQHLRAQMMDLVQQTEREDMRRVGLEEQNGADDGQ